MIAEQFSSSEIDCLIKTAVELWEDIDESDLSERQLEVLDRARAAMYAEYAGETPEPSPLTPSSAATPGSESLIGLDSLASENACRSRRVVTTVVSRRCEVEVLLAVSDAPPVRFPGANDDELYADRLQVLYRREGAAGEWQPWSWWLQGVLHHRSQPDQSTNRPASISQAELLRWDTPGTVPKWLTAAVERHRRDLT